MKNAYNKPTRYQVISAWKQEPGESSVIEQLLPARDCSLSSSQSHPVTCQAVTGLGHFGDKRSLSAMEIHMLLAFVMLINSTQGYLIYHQK